MKQCNCRIRLILLVAAILVALNAGAQLRYGLNLGMDVARTSLGDAPGYGMVNRSGFRGGLMLEYQTFSSGLAFDGAVLYNRVNSRVRDEAGDGAVRSYGRNFIEVPLNVKYKFGLHALNDIVSPMLFTGPSFMFNVDGKKGTPLKQKRFQPGWNVGAGVDVVNFVQISAGYRFALSDGCDKFDGAPDATLHTKGWFVQAAILFDF